MKEEAREKNILGCYVSVTSGNFNDSHEKKDLSNEQGRLFREYIWGEKGICDTLKKLEHINYGKDLELILFQFYVNPLPVELENMKEIENYRKKEKAIGIPVIINKDFFSKDEIGRINFINKLIFEKLDVLENVIAKKRLDTNIQKLKEDLKKLLIN